VRRAGQYNLLLDVAALEYWFNAANDGLIPKKNNLLVSPNPSVVRSRNYKLETRSRERNTARTIGLSVKFVKCLHFYGDKRELLCML